MLVNRLPQAFKSDDQRVLARFFCPGDDARNRRIVQRVLGLGDRAVAKLLDRVLRDFAPRHHDIKAVFREHFGRISHLVPPDTALGDERQLLIGAYFTMEYAIESAALFNPSIVPYPRQDGLAEGSTRFLMSLRATGEGHVSSIVFRRGTIDRDNKISVDPVGRHTRQVKLVEDRQYDQHLFRMKLIEMGAYDDQAESALTHLGPHFTFQQLNDAIEQARQEAQAPELLEQSAHRLLWLARSNYHLYIPPEVDPSEIVIFPSVETEIHGLEDARLVRFTDDDGTVQYYGTYTAFDGSNALPQLIETTDFRTVRVHTLNGRYVQQKGLALFPRRIEGKYLMIARLDGESLSLMRSDNVRFWNQAEPMQNPKYPWEFVQIGNCGSPLETEEGWLLLTHGVGPVREYCLGVSLLDRENPARVIGQLREPLIVPTAAERNGYVPNVVYTCGAMIHHETLVIPYAVSDRATSFATVSLPELLSALKGPAKGR